MTKAYVWEYQDDITDNWHSGGGVLIITDRDPAEAWEEIKRKDSPYIGVLGEPDYTYPLKHSQQERVVVFPDAGCC